MCNVNKVIGIIPARYGSTRFPGKPLVPILGKTLLQRTYENAQRAACLDTLLVATDDQRIMDHVESFGGVAIMTSKDCLNGTDRIAEVLQHYPEYLEAAAIVNIQGDHPCLDPLAIHAVAHLLISHPDIPMSTVVAPLCTEEEAHNLSVVKCVLDQQQHALYFSRHILPANIQGKFNASHTYFHHMGLYAYRPSFLLTYQKLRPTPLQLAEDLEQLKVLEHGYRIKVAIINQSNIGVDTPEDISKIERWICTQNTFL